MLPGDDGQVRSRPADLGRKLIKDPLRVMAVAWGFVIGLAAGAFFFGVPSRVIFGKTTVAGVVTLALILATAMVGAYLTLTLTRRDCPRPDEPWKS